ncbi:MAG TPA: heavy metal translocating P-type ATPase [Solirubrobacteraceae bacterium]|nr:heavy metal translocating P-type ATPase [Solirubrobacteraceae bacterium]
MAVAPSPTAAAPAGRGPAPSRRAPRGPSWWPGGRDAAIALGELAAIAGGGVLHVAGAQTAAHAVWALAIALALGPLTWEIAKSLRHGDVGVDVIALLAMAGALALGEYLAGAVIALMLSGGNALEATAGRRARRELTALVARAPRIAHRRRGDELVEVPVEALEVGDRVVVRTGEVVPVDGVVDEDEAVLDESTITGESLPVARRRGEPALSGTANAGPPFELRVTHRAEDSTYSALVRIVRAAEAQKPRFVRMADRYAGFFLPATILVAGGAWAASGDPVRALAVLVVATPCPLILAAPIAIVSGISRAAHHGVIVKGGPALERLAAARSVLLDKTGTLTLGTAELDGVTTLDGTSPDELLRLAASVDQLSPHVLAEAIVHAAEARGMRLAFPEEVAERPGDGVEGRVDGRRVAVGSTGWLRARGIEVDPVAVAGLERGAAAGRARALVAVDGRLAGAVLLADRLRDDARELTERLHAAGIAQVAMVTGDRADVAQAVARELNLDRVYAEQTPEEKLEIVRALRERPRAGRVVMVGDGVNDAPALALADVGVAMGVAGATVASETADAVITVNRVDRVADAITISRRAFGIARQSVLAGMGLSLAAMGFAAAGLLAPVAGAMLQEVIDVAVILNALRALR